MAWIVVDLDGTLVHPEEEMQAMEAENQAQVGEMGVTGEPQEDPSAMPPMLPMDGALEAMQQLAAEGHRLTVFTARFAPMPDSERQRLKEQIETELAAVGFPPMEVWTGTSKPSADIFIDDNAVTFDGDWGLALAQTQVMLEERGLVPGPQPDNGMVPPEEVPQE